MKPDDIKALREQEARQTRWIAWGFALVLACMYFGWLA